jgi:hypothetical protein
MRFLWAFRYNPLRAQQAADSGPAYASHTQGRACNQAPRILDAK